MSVQANITPSVLKWCRQESGFEVREVAAAIKEKRVTPRTIQAWEQGEQRAFLQWVAQNKYIFPEPTQTEQQKVRIIARAKEFQNLIHAQTQLKGSKRGGGADMFVIAKAIVENRTIVTREKYKLNKVAQHYGVQCITPEQFLKQQNIKI